MRAGLSSRMVMGTRGSGHWGVGGLERALVVDGRHTIGAADEKVVVVVLVLAAEKSPLKRSLLRLLGREGGGVGKTGMGSCEPDCRLLLFMVWWCWVERFRREGGMGMRMGRRGAGEMKEIYLQIGCWF